MSTLRFKIVTREGETVTGPVQGFGGFVGDGVTQIAPEERERVSLERVRKAIECANEGSPLPVLEWSSSRGADYYPTGLVGVYPEFSNERNGPLVLVSLKGASADLVRS